MFVRTAAWLVAPLIALAVPATAPAAVPCAAGITCPATLFVDSQGAAPDQVRAYKAEGRLDEAAAAERIAGQPQPEWVTGSAEDVAGEVRPYLDRARTAGGRPFLVGYAHPRQGLRRRVLRWRGWRRRGVQGLVHGVRDGTAGQRR